MILYVVKNGQYKMDTKSDKPIDIHVILDQAVEKVKTILEKQKICESHGFSHMYTVMQNAKSALVYHPTTLSMEIQLFVLLAALLHDIDDYKFFPKHKNNENARTILKELGIKEDVILEMIDLVSCSKNGDSMPKELPEYYYPRYADRLEAIGQIGIKRCYQYCTTVKLPMYIESTKRAKDEKDLWDNIATKQRYSEYKGISVSMIDHYYDKLLQTSNFPIRNAYFDSECKKRNQVLVDFILEFGKHGEITKNMQKLME